MANVIVVSTTLINAMEYAESVGLRPPGKMGCECQPCDRWVVRGKRPDRWIVVGDTGQMDSLALSWIMSTGAPVEFV